MPDGPCYTHHMSMGGRKEYGLDLYSVELYKGVVVGMPPYTHTQDKCNNPILV